MIPQIHADQTILITGASSGIGEAAARRLAAEGANVILLARNLTALEKIADEINQAKVGGKAFAYKVDLSKVDEMVEVAKKVKEKFGALDVLVNNAGAGKWTSLLEKTPYEIEQDLAVPGRCTAVMMNLFMPGMIENGTKKNPSLVVNVMSPAAHVRVPGVSTYGDSRAQVLSTTQHTRDDLRNHKTVAIATLCPGKTKTPYFETNGDNKQENRVPMQRFIPELNVEYVAKRLSDVIKNRKSVDEVFPAPIKALVVANKACPSLIQFALTHVFGWQPPAVAGEIPYTTKLLSKVALIATLGLAAFTSYKARFEGN